MPAILERALTPGPALNGLDDAVDLSMLRLKLSDAEEGPCYSGAHIGMMEGEYRKCLALKLAFPDEEIVPRKVVDEMWHRHILDTAACRDDCDRIFGGFVDHFPYFGMWGEADAKALEDAYAETLRRYRAFGEPPTDTWVSAQPTRCRTACKPVRCK